MLSLVMVEKVRVSDAQRSSWVGTCWRKEISFGFVHPTILNEVEPRWSSSSVDNGSVVVALHTAAHCRVLHCELPCTLNSKEVAKVTPMSKAKQSSGWHPGLLPGLCPPESRALVPCLGSRPFKSRALNSDPRVPWRAFQLGRMDIGPRDPLPRVLWILGMKAWGLDPDPGPCGVCAPGLPKIGLWTSGMLSTLAACS